MFRKRRNVGILVVACILAVTVAGVAMAETQSDPANSNPFQIFLAKFAANLGVDQDKVSAALEATNKQMLDEAVQQGKLTQEQADKIAAGTKGKPGFFCGFQGKMGEGKRDIGENGRGFMFNIDKAQILGITSEQLKSELQSGKGISQIITDHGLTIEQFNQKVLEAQKEALAKAVSEEKLTQEQADKITADMQNRPGFIGGFHGKMGFPQRQNNPAPDSGTSN